MRTVPYFGGKNERSNSGVGPWIAALLPPPQKAQTYVEPFAGMLGVLVQRRPVNAEIVNDKDRLIVNWWRVVRDHPDELAHLLRTTPRSRIVFSEACDIVNQARATGESGVRVAWATMIIITQGRMKVLRKGEEQSSDWYQIKANTRMKPNPTAEAALWIDGLAERLRSVQLECCDAVKLIDSVADSPDVVVYCDPPYPSMVNDHLYYETLDDTRFIDAILECSCRVAVSGYVGDWPQLDEAGWRREERPVRITVAQGGDRVEALWCNYPPVANRLF